jgi:quercetin dioxygenase-like cupin family protein
MIEGQLLVKYDDGSEEMLTPGDVFYMPPGHTAVVIKDMKFLDFSPEKELDVVLDHIAKKLMELRE